jgi:alpha-mannosidase
MLEARESEGSRFVQRISLASGAAGDRVNVSDTIDWQTRERSLKATFPLTVANADATYQISVGTLPRANNDPKKYEVPQHQWFDLTDADGKYGVAVLNDCKYGSDKPADNELRLTLIYTPGTRGGYRDQGTQDIGRHQIDYAIAPHAGDWRDGKVQWNARQLNQPLMVFQTSSHAGPLGKAYSLLKVSSDQVGVEAIKKAEESDEIVVRLKELDGKSAEGVRISTTAGIASAREVSGQERSPPPRSMTGDRDDMKPYQLRAFAIAESGGHESITSEMQSCMAVQLRCDQHGRQPRRWCIRYDGRTYPAEQMPAKIVSEGIEFATGPKRMAEQRCDCKGQTIQSPVDSPRPTCRVRDRGDQPVTFKIGIDTREAQEWGPHRPVGQPA